MGILFGYNSAILSPHLSFCRIKGSAPFDHPFNFAHDAVGDLRNLCLHPPQVFGGLIMGFGLWVLLDNQSFIAVLRKYCITHTHTKPLI